MYKIRLYTFSNFVQIPKDLFEEKNPISEQKLILYVFFIIFILLMSHRVSFLLIHAFSECTDPQAALCVCVCVCSIASELNCRYSQLLLFFFSSFSSECNVTVKIHKMIICIALFNTLVLSLWIIKQCQYTYPSVFLLNCRQIQSLFCTLRIISTVLNISENRLYQKLQTSIHDTLFRMGNPHISE